MPRFHYQALNADQQVVSGEVEAEAVALAIAQIEASGLIMQSIGFATAETAAALAAREATPVPPKRSPPIAAERRDEIALRSHLGRTLERGKPLVPPLRAYAEEMPPGRRRRELSQVYRILERGDVAEATASLSSFPEYWIPLIGIAAGSNDQGRILQGFIAESQQADETRRQWWTLLAYPLFLVGFAAAVLVVLAYMVVPTFRIIFEDFDLELPLLTLWTLNVSQWITSGAPLLIVIALFVIAGLAVTFGGKALGELYGAIFGRSAAIATFAGFTADLLEGGIDVPDAVRIAGRTTKGGRLRGASQTLAPQLEAGDVDASQRLRRPLTATVFHAVTADMSPVARMRLLQEVAACYADRARSRLSWTQGILGPMTIFVVGFLVAFVALSLFLPLVDLINNLSG